MKYTKLNKMGSLNKASSGSAGHDLVMASEDPVYLYPQTPTLVKTGIAIEIPEYYVGMVCPRSGLALKSGVTVLNAPGIIDSDYRGEIGVILINLSESLYKIYPGDRVAQLVIVKLCFATNLELVDTLSATKRNDGGFGSTGK